MLQSYDSEASESLTLLQSFNSEVSESLTLLKSFDSEASESLTLLQFFGNISIKHTLPLLIPETDTADVKEGQELQ